MQLFLKILCGMANSVDPGQIALSRSALLAYAILTETGLRTFTLCLEVIIHVYIYFFKFLLVFCLYYYIYMCNEIKHSMISIQRGLTHTLDPFSKIVYYKTFFGYKAVEMWTPKMLYPNKNV